MEKLETYLLYLIRRNINYYNKRVILLYIIQTAIYFLLLRLIILQVYKCKQLGLKMIC